MQNPGRYLFIIFMIFTTLAAAPKPKFSFTMQADKTDAYIGEPVKITFLFKYPVDIQVAEANFAPPTFHDFWTKAGKDVPNIIKNGYHHYHLDYIITPQKTGKIEIEPARMDIGILKSNQHNTLRFDRVKWKSIFSNNLTVNVKPLPDNVTLFGEYHISAKVDKNVTKANEPVNLTVTVTGNGNIEDIDDFTITSDEAAVYADKAKRRTHFEKGVQKAVLTQKFAFIADRNFTIPSLSLTYFDSKSKKVTTVKTEPIQIQVLGKKAAFPTTRLEKRETSLPAAETGKSGKLWIATLIGGFLVGILLTTLWLQRKKIFGATKAEYPVETKIKKAKNDKALLALLLPYSGKSEKLDVIIKKLEENLYNSANHKINRNELAKNFSKYVTITPDEAEILL